MRAKLALIARMKAELKPLKASFSPEQKRLYKDLGKLKKKVDRGSLKEIAKMTGRTTAGVAGGAASAAIIVGAVGLAALAGGGGGGDMMCCWGPSIGGGGGSFGSWATDQHLHNNGGNLPSGVYLDDAQLTV